MGNTELIELRQTPATIQSSSCLKHVPKGMNMCQCGVWVRPNQSTMDRIRAALAALKNLITVPQFSCQEGERTDTTSGRTIIKNAMDARRGATKRHEYTSFLDEKYRAPQLAHGWAGTRVRYLDYISKIDISHEAPYRQRLRYESTLKMSGVDSNEQAGPLCQRPDYKSSAQALVSLQRNQGKVYLTFRCTRGKDKITHLDRAVQQHSEWLNFNWKTFFSSSSSSTMAESPTWWSSSSWDHQWQEWHSQGWQDKDGTKGKNDNDRFMFRLARKLIASEHCFDCFQVDVSSDCDLQGRANHMTRTLPPSFVRVYASGDWPHGWRYWSSSVIDASFRKLAIFVWPCSL